MAMANVEDEAHHGYHLPLFVAFILMNKPWNQCRFPTEAAGQAGVATPPLLRAFGSPACPQASVCPMPPLPLLG